MRRTIIWIMSVFLLDLIAEVGVSTWKSPVMSNTITAKSDGNIALFRLGGKAQNKVLGLGMAVENLFKATSASEIDTAKKNHDQHSDSLSDIITTTQDPQFIAPLSNTLDLPDGTHSEPLQKSVGMLVTGKDALKAAVTQEIVLTNTRTELNATLVGAKNDLSTVVRKTFDLSIIDFKAYSSLVRSIIATVFTDSPADVKFVRLKIYENSYPTLAKATLSDEQKTNFITVNTQFMATYKIVRQNLSTGSDGDFFQRVTQY